MKRSPTNDKTGAERKRFARRERPKKSSPGEFVRKLRGTGVVIGEKMRLGVTAADVIKYVVYALLGLFLVILKTTFFSRFRPFGASPDILIAAVAAFALYEGGQAGAIFGIAVGYAADALGGVGVVLLPLPYMLVGYFCGVVATDHYKRTPLLFIIFDLCADVVRAVTSLFYVMLTWHSFDLGVVIRSVIVPEFLSTLIVSPIPALLLLPVYLIFRKKKKQLD